MRILRLRFFNINSLQGEHVVDFEQGPLSTTGIFAIVGPTGSGKSTLLDVITLAIYGQIPRNEKAITKTQVEGMGSIVTHHQKEAWAEVSYGTDSGKYVSRWEIRQTRTGNWSAHKMTLATAEGQILAEKLKEVVAENMAIIGLSYQQFIKSILLSQGDFARFLSSKKNERAQLLEDITGTHLYRDLGRAAFERQKAANEAIKRLETRMGDIALMDEETRANIEGEVAALRVSIDTMQRDIATLDGHIQRQTEHQKLQSEEQELGQAKAGLSQREQAFEADKARLAIHHKVLPYATDLEIHRGLRQSLAQREAEILQHEANAKAAQQHIEELIETLTAYVGETIVEDTWLAANSHFEQEINAMDQALATLADRGREKRAALNEQLGKAKGELFDRLRESSDPAVIIHAVAEVRANLPKVSEPLSTLENRLEEGQKELLALTQERQRATVIAKHGAEQEQIKTDQKSLAELLAQATEASAQLKAKLAQNIKQVDQLTADKIKQAAITSLDDRREQLVSGEPCPLCGATDHPYARHQALERYVSIDQDLMVAKAAVEQQTKEQEHLTQQIAAAKSRQSSLQQRQQRLEEELKQLSQQPTQPLQEVEGAIKAKSGELATDKGLIQAARAEEVLSLVAQAASQLSGELAAYQAKREVRMKRYAGKDVSGEMNALQNRFLKAQTQRNTAKTSIHQLLATNEKDKATINEKASQLTPVAMEMGQDSIEALRAMLLPRDEEQRIATERDALHTEATKLKERQTHIAERLAVLAPQLKEAPASLVQMQEDRAAAVAENNRLNQQHGAKQQQLREAAARQAQVAALLGELEAERGEAKKWILLNNLIGDATGNKFAHFAQELTLQNLIALANRRMDELTDRYLIAPPSDDEYLRVVDRYQGNITRSVKTLSGGETFLLSLALALSLSDLASKKVRLESLFIDEGFGTLDRDTLDTALTTLERLQSGQNKTIGIISHVEALKDRIPVQIVLDKNEQGISSLSLKEGD